ncbi:hypothetical protein EDB81DRAFT_833990 [Dactylonectria macrodidyma]|uniref:Uncharacterized protein n=1 Tax=Dactylonectria macrodidyma TaxID=307937 RepID=A0A9P9CYF4_9HYPO|nr:hypothetical protein EDB81DRAFT_833990 [Dactylonectria macrodidyma]
MMALIVLKLRGWKGGLVPTNLAGVTHSASSLLRPASVMLTEYEAHLALHFRATRDHTSFPSQNRSELSYIFNMKMDRQHPLPSSASYDSHPTMIGSVGWRGRQPHSSIRAPGQHTSEPIETTIEPDGMRAMSPRMTSEDVEALEREMHTELRRHAKALQGSLLLIFNRVETVKKGHEKLNSNNKLLQKYIGDLTISR